IYPLIRHLSSGQTCGVPHLPYKRPYRFLLVLPRVLLRVLFHFRVSAVWINVLFSPSLSGRLHTISLLFEELVPVPTFSALVSQLGLPGLRPLLWKAALL